MTKGQRTLLPPDEEARLKQIQKEASPALRQRAQVLLAWHDGLTAGETGKRIKLSENQVRYLWKLYKDKGIDLFLVDPEPIKTTTNVNANETAQVAELDEPGTKTLEALYAEYRIDLAHAQHVGNLATKIFDATMTVHRLPSPARQLLEAAALVHNLAYNIDQPNHHITGRNILLAQPIRGFSETERQILACTTSFHRRKVRPQTDPAYKALTPDLQRNALALSAILRVADGLDFSFSQSTLIEAINVSAEEVLIVVAGPQSDKDADKSQKLADLWMTTFPVPVRVIIAQPKADIILPARILPAASPALTPRLSLKAAGWLFVSQTLDRLDILFHHLRAGTPDVLPSLHRELLRLQEALGIVQVDCPAVLAKLIETTYQARLGLALHQDLDGLVSDTYVSQEQLMKHLTDAQAALTTAVNTIDINAYQHMATSLRQQATPEAITAKGVDWLAYHAGQLLWTQLAMLRRVMEFSESVPEALEAVRRLHDYMLAFRGVLGTESTQAIDMLMTLESYLTAINLAQVTLANLESVPVKRGRGRKPAVSTPDPVFEIVKQEQSELLVMLVESLPEVWGAINSVLFRRAFALAIAEQ